MSLISQEDEYATRRAIEAIDSVGAAFTKLYEQVAADYEEMKSVNELQLNASVEKSAPVSDGTGPGTVPKMRRARTPASRSPKTGQPEFDFVYLRNKPDEAIFASTGLLWEAIRHLEMLEALADSAKASNITMLKALVLSVRHDLESTFDADELSACNGKSVLKELISSCLKAGQILKRSLGDAGDKHRDVVKRVKDFAEFMPRETRLACDRMGWLCEQVDDVAKLLRQTDWAKILDVDVKTISGCKHWKRMHPETASKAKKPKPSDAARFGDASQIAVDDKANN